MNAKIAKAWAVAQIVIGVGLACSTAYYAPSAFNKMKEESRNAGVGLRDVAEALVAVRVTYAETATNLFDTASGMSYVEIKLQDIGGGIGDVGHQFEERGRKFERSERHNRESKIFWGKMETPFANYLADIYGDLKEWSLNAGTKLCNVGRDLSDVAATVGKQREAIAKYQQEGHPKTLKAIESSAETIGHVGELLAEGESIDILARSVCILCGIVALLFISNGVVLLIVTTHPKPPAT